METIIYRQYLLESSPVCSWGAVGERLANFRNLIEILGEKIGYQGGIKLLSPLSTTFLFFFFSTLENRPHFPPPWFLPHYSDKVFGWSWHEWNYEGIAQKHPWIVWAQNLSQKNSVQNDGFLWWLYSIIINHLGPAGLAFCLDLVCPQLRQRIRDTELRQLCVRGPGSVPVWAVTWGCAWRSSGERKALPFR